MTAVARAGVMAFGSRWPRVFPGPAGKGVLKGAAEDFQVEEVLGFDPGGGGEHVFLWVEKQGMNTAEVAAALAGFAGVPRERVGYAGLKDRHGITRQWFCVHLPGKRDPPWMECACAGFRVLRWTRHGRRLRRGALAGNRFRIRIREFRGDWECMVGILEEIACHGMANYFGPQRFGRGCANLIQAGKMLEGQIRVRDRHRRGLYLSAARALIFNEVLARRVGRGDWNQAVHGDLMMFSEGKTFFRAGFADAAIQARLRALEIHPSGPLWGSGERAEGDAGILEDEVAAAYPLLAEGLARHMKMMRRPLRVVVRELEWGFKGEDVHLGCFLPAGSYATTLLSELIATEEEGG